MTEEELNSYRLTSLEEPSDEMLAAIMKEAAEDARKRSEEATRKFFAELNREAQKIIDERNKIKNLP
ncbi:MAG: hypothetical protein LUC85_05380 [Bacteroidales bacterium]|nr:hypothetical protein [Bacteroidales bacterium]MCD8394252.1 hypothetical protein [Bacteroidales bacterium]